MSASEIWGTRRDGREVEMTVAAAPLHCNGIDQVALFLMDRNKEAALARMLNANAVVAATLAKAASFETVAACIVQGVCDCFGWRCGEWWHLEHDSQRWNRAAVWHSQSNPRLETSETSFPIEGGLPGRVRTERKPIWLSDLKGTSRARNSHEMGRIDLHQAIGIPIALDDHVTDVLLFYDVDLPSPDLCYLATVTAIGIQVSQFVKKRQTDNALRIAEENQQQSQKMDAIGRLAGGIAHDFNNILTIILGHSEIATDLLDKRSGAGPHLTGISDAAQRAAGLTRQLLAFSRKEFLEPIVIDVNAAVRELEKLLVRLIGDSISLQTELDPCANLIRVDPARFEQVILNLAVNARDAMADGGNVLLQTSNTVLDARAASKQTDVQPGDYVAVAVSDNGCGMDDWTQKRIFEPFFTTKPTDKGTGMGLSTVHGIVKQSGGFITVESQPGRGSTFTVFFPRAHEALVPIEADGTPICPPCGTETILLVEDDDVVRSLMVQLLKQRGYDVLDAASGNDALQLLVNTDSRPDLLLTDIIMPEMTGPELASRISKLYSDTKVLFMSAYTDSSVLTRVVVEPGRMFLQKPFTSVLLAQKVREALDRSLVAR
jgi:signal transduction histidine kinase